MPETLTFQFIKYNDFDRLIQTIDSVSTDELEVRVKLLGAYYLINDEDMWSRLTLFVNKHSTYWRVRNILDNAVMRVIHTNDVHGLNTIVDHEVHVIFRPVGVEDL